jgi:hypothetical protein
VSQRRDIESQNPDQLGARDLGCGTFDWGGAGCWEFAYAVEVPTSGDKSSPPILCPVVLKSSTRTLLPAPAPVPSLATSAVLSNQAVALFRLSTV